MQPHWDALEPRHRFRAVSFNGQAWDLTHLDPFALRVEISPGLIVDVVVFFSCHCFSHEVASDQRLRIPAAELYLDGFERRVLNPERYRLSRLFFPSLIRELPTRRIRVVEARRNFFTLEGATSDGRPTQYAAFFEVTRDAVRKKRLLLRVQTAFPMDDLGKRYAKAGKVNFNVLIKAAYEGRMIRG